MRTHSGQYYFVALTVPYLLVAIAHAGSPSGTAFKYQGQLKESGVPVNATCDFEVSLWGGDNDPDPGTQLGSTIPLTTEVGDGLFELELDFGAAAFNGDARWLQIDVCCVSPCSPAFVTLTPRQPITPAPYAVQTRGLFVDHAGNVNIGTDTPDTGPNPATKLYLEGAGYPGAFMTLNANGGNFDAGLHLRNDGDLKWHIFNQAASDTFNLRNPAFEPVIVATQEGDIGLGTATPQGKLHVAGVDPFLSRVESSSTIGTWFILKNTSADGRDWSLVSTGEANGEGPGDLLFYDTTTGRTRMDIDGPTGNVGIGTTTPLRKLQIGDISIPDSEGMLRLASRSGTQGSHRIWDLGVPETDEDSTGEGYSFVIDDIEAGTGAEFMVKFGSGNVGIGTTAPVTKLHVEGAGFPGSFLTLNGNGGDFDAGLNLNHDGAVKWHVFNQGVGDSFNLRDAAFDPVLVAAQGGNVGIGTAAPAYPLHVKKTQAGDWIAGIHNVGTEASDHGLVVRADGGDPFLVQSATANLVSVKQDGNVGIGTTTPFRRLQVGDTSIANSEGMIRLASRSGTQGSNRVWDVGVPETDADSSGAGYSFVIDDTQTGTDPEFMVKFGSGNVGIGTVTPQGKLDVNGSIFQRGGNLHADYVFDPGYDLESIEEHSTFMWSKGHLPAVPQAKKDAEGKDVVEVGSHRRGILEELEKAHIYIERLHADNKYLEQKISEKDERLATMEERLARLEQLVLSKNGDDGRGAQ